jgi:outer membrane lipoprotein-sorting protein
MDLTIALLFLILSLSFLIFTIIGSEKENISELMTEELNRLKRVGVAFVLFVITAYLAKTYWWSTIQELGQIMLGS